MPEWPGILIECLEHSDNCGSDSECELLILLLKSRSKTIAIANLLLQAFVDLLVWYQSMAPNRKRKLEREIIELKCEFSECQEMCSGMDQLSTHVKQHVELMREQLDGLSTDSNGVEPAAHCACPWRECDVLLNYTEDWSKCQSHIYFHAFHTYAKCLGDHELARRNVPMHCGLDASRRNIVPDLPEALKCQWQYCTFETVDPWHYYRHAEAHGFNQSLDNTWSCHWGNCEYTGKTTTRLKDHIRAHTQERRYACSHCGLLVSTSTRLEDHQKRQAVGDQMFQCSHCSKRYAAERLLRDHLRKHVNLYACMFCDMTCPTPSALRIHILYRHSTERPYSCDHCDKRFKTKFDVATHQMVHDLDGMAINCPVEHCGFSTKNTNQMLQHHKIVHKEGGRVFGCHICDELFAQSREISKHLMDAHSLKLPSGHVRFRFAPDSDGIRRLVTVRFECLQERNDSDLDTNTEAQLDGTSQYDESFSMVDDSSIAPSSPCSSIMTAHNGGQPI